MTSQHGEHTINLGWNGDPELPTKLANLNETYRGKARIKSVYGSIPRHAWLSARPDFRLPDASMEFLASQISELSAQNIGFNYTFNANYIGNKRWLKEEGFNELLTATKELLDIGVDRFIVSNPIIFDFLTRKMKGDSRIKFEISTIAHVDSVMQLIALKEYFPAIDTICGNLLKNREFKFLKKAAEVSKAYGITYEILANEFCSTGFASGGTHCIFRDSCYTCHCENVTKEDALIHFNYPMGNCMASRSNDPVDWLRSSFVRPQDLEIYKSIGISQFKVTGRTATTPYLMLMAEAYLSGKWPHNILELWKPLETIYNNKTEAEHKHKHDIPADKLDGFLSKWFDSPEFSCNDVTCQECRYCDTFYKMKVQAPEDDKKTVGAVFTKVN